MKDQSYENIEGSKFPIQGSLHRGVNRGQLWLLSGNTGILGFTTGRVVSRDELEQESTAPVHVAAPSDVTDLGH